MDIWGSSYFQAFLRFPGSLFNDVLYPPLLSQLLTLQNVSLLSLWEEQMFFSGPLKFKVVSMTIWNPPKLETSQGHTHLFLFYIPMVTMHSIYSLWLCITNVEIASLLYVFLNYVSISCVYFFFLCPFHFSSLQIIGSNSDIEFSPQND